jgi:5-oxoprolinase (ATP-hydrolysing) subunit A
VDLNSDLGEGFGVWRLGDDEALLDIVTSANVACGFHAGDASTMRRMCAVAAARGVSIGAQVSYRDLAGFGRRRIDYDPDELRDDIVYQIGALAAFAACAGTRVRYVKPHGALYNTAAVDAGQAGAVVAAVHDVDPALPLLCQPGSVLAARGESTGLRVVAEAFADRAYLPDGRLVPRSSPGAVIHDPDAVVERTVRMARDGSIVAVDGSVLRLPVESICLHGDTPGAVVLASRVRAALAEAGVPLVPFVR